MFTPKQKLDGLMPPNIGYRIIPRSNTWLRETKTNPKGPKTNHDAPQRGPSDPNEPPNEPLLGQTYAIKHVSQAFFLKAKAVRKYKYSTVQSALWQSQDKGSADASTIQCRLHFGRMLIL